MDYQGIQIARAILKTNKTEELMLPYSKMYNKAKAIKTLCYWH